MDIKFLPIEQRHRVQVDHHGCVEFTKINNYYKNSSFINIDKFLKSNITNNVNLSTYNNLKNVKCVDSASGSCDMPNVCSGPNAELHVTCEECLNVDDKWVDIEYVVMYCMFKNESFLRDVVSVYTNKLRGNFILEQRRAAFKSHLVERMEAIHKRIYLASIPTVNSIYSDPRHTDRDMFEVINDIPVAADLHTLKDILITIKPLLVSELCCEGEEGTVCDTQKTTIIDRYISNNLYVDSLELYISQMYNTCTIQRKVFNYNQKNQSIKYELCNSLVRIIIHYLKTRGLNNFSIKT